MQPVSGAGFLYYLYYYTPLHLLTAGREAVLVFFALSGFVLTLSLENASVSYGKYLVRRMCRIVVPYAASVIVAAALYSIIHGLSFPNELSPWARELVPEDISPRETLANIAMSGLDWHMKINPVAWSLVHEIRISMLMPLIVFLVVTAPTITMVAAIGFLVIGLFWPEVYLNNAFSAAVTVLQTLIYVPVFVLGAILAIHRQAVSSWFRRRTAGQTLLIVLVIYIAVQFRWLVSDNETLALIANAIGAALVIALAFSLPSMVRILENGVLVFLGRISYSLYLSHMAIMLLVVVALGHMMRLEFILPFAAVVCVALAYVFYRLVERPSVKLANLLFKTRRKSGETASVP